MVYDHQPTPRCRIVISGQKDYTVHILFEKLKVVKLSGILEFLLQKYSPYSTIYKFCPGIDQSTYQLYFNEVHFDPKSLRKIEHPTQ